MIFLTIGTHEPFDRLVRAVDDWCATRQRADVFGQITDRAAYLPTHFKHVGTLTPESYRDACDRADFLIAHAGMGSIITALTLGRRIAVMPRRGHLSETRNDHQLTTAARLGTKPGIHVAMGESELSGVLDQLAGAAGAGPALTIEPFAQETLILALQRLVEQTDEPADTAPQARFPLFHGVTHR